jgi:hypothetical protein
VAGPSAVTPSGRFGRNESGIFGVSVDTGQAIVAVEFLWASFHRSNGCDLAWSTIWSMRDVEDADRKNGTLVSENPEQYGA